MANKYKDYDKYMLSFTIPSKIDFLPTRKYSKVKNGRYTKLRYLIDLKAFIAKEINNSKADIKYFMNIELGKAYSNPHLHIQIWAKDHMETSSDLIEHIFNKVIAKYDLNKSRCKITSPEQDIPVYNYVIKDYAKDLDDKSIWDLEIQKKRMRKQIGKQVRFYSKSSDRYSKKVYRLLYRFYSVSRSVANDYVEKFLDLFFKISNKNLIRFRVFVREFSELVILLNKERVYVFSFIFYIIPYCLDPPSLIFISFYKI